MRSRLLVAMAFFILALGCSPSAPPPSLTAIWRLESGTVDGKEQSVPERPPDYLVLRDDKTFRFIKKGKKRAGTWEINTKGQLVLNLTNDEPRIADIKHLPGDKLELRTTDQGNALVMQYARTDLTVEPKAADE